MQSAGHRSKCSSETTYLYVEFVSTHEASEDFAILPTFHGDMRSCLLKAYQMIDRRHSAEGTRRTGILSDRRAQQRGSVWFLV